MITNLQLKLDHLFRLTDCTGMIQHSKYSVPDLATGYTTDDNARALIVAAMLNNKYDDEKLNSLIYRYMSFMTFAQNPLGRWKNFMNYQREFIEEQGSEDSFGRSLWSLGFLTSTTNIPKEITETANVLIKNALPNLSSITAIRALCYSLIGLVHLYNSKNNAVTKKLINSIADNITNRFASNKSENWYWYENIVTYANGIIPYSLLKAYSVTEKKKHLETALNTLQFLENITLKNGYLKLIGCKGWAVKGQQPALFDEQPIDAADMVLVNAEAYKLTNDTQYLQKTETCFNWFLGLNCQSIPVLNIDTGGCFDGITKSGVNFNQGAESLFAYLISHITAEELGIISLENKDSNTGTLEEAV